MDRTVELPISIKAKRDGDSLLLQWHLVDERSDGSTLTFKSPNRELFNLVFTIEPNDVELEFPEDPLDAFWVAKDANPTNRSFERDYEPVSVSDDGQRLVVLNINRAPAKYFYALNFNSSVGPVRLVGG